MKSVPFFKMYFNVIIYFFIFSVISGELLCEFEQNGVGVMDCTPIGEKYNSIDLIKHVTYVRFTDIDFAHFQFAKTHTIEKLILKDSNLKNLDARLFAYLENLKYLDVSGNPKLNMTGDLKYLKSLKSLNLSGSPTDMEGFTKIENLRTLDISNQRKSFSNISIFHNLFTLDVSNNKLLNLSNDGIGNTLKTLIASNIEVQLGENSFKNATGLDTLIMTNNRIRNISKSSFTSLLSIPRIDLSYNDMTEEGLPIFPRSYFINLSHNQISTLKKSNIFPPGLKILDLSHNSIRHLDPDLFEGSRDLNYLNLAGNQLNEIFIDLVKNLHHLDLSKNLLGSSRVTIIMLPSKLQSINLSENDLKTFNPTVIRNTPTLKHLDLSYNKLKSIPKKLFQSLPELKLMNLKANLLKAIPEELIFMKNLTHLIISCNQLSNLPLNSTCTRSQILKIYAYSNPWKCSCISSMLAADGFEYDKQYFTDGSLSFCIMRKEDLCDATLLSEKEYETWKSSNNQKPCYEGLF